MILLVDLDGTLLNNSQRKAFVPVNPKNNSDWHEFNSRCANDELNMPMVELFKELQKKAERTWFVTSRPIAYYQLSKLSLTGLTWDGMVMRSEDDTSSCADFKRKAFQMLGASIGDIVLEDSKQVIDMAIEEFGCTVFRSNITCSSLIAKTA